MFAPWPRPTSPKRFSRQQIGCILRFRLGIVYAANPLYYDVISAFGRETGTPVLVNTSFDVHEEPIVNTPGENTPGECAKALVDGRIDFVVTQRAIYEAAAARHDRSAIESYCGSPAVPATSSRSPWPQAGLAMFGTAAAIADEMEDRLGSDAWEELIVMFPYRPGGLDDFVNEVVPELQRRGIFQREYDGATLRENLGLSRPKSRFF